MRGKGRKGATSFSTLPFMSPLTGKKTFHAVERDFMQ